MGNVSDRGSGYAVPTGTTIPKGNYTIGEEIPAGTYKIFFGGSTTSRVRVFQDANEASNTFNKGKETMGRLGDGTRKFDFVVNGHKIFMKGGNWVPADSLYLRVPEEKYKNLVREAAACGSNMLRVWGGGLYEPDCFYDACSENGILIMQDFMYACGFYPDHLPWFMHEAALEADYQTKRLAHQACMAVWTGNNEIHESYTDWYGKSGMQPEKLNGAEIFNYLLPETMNKNCPSIPYMPSSPFFGSKANDLLAGDCHIWSWTRSDRPTGFKYFYELEAMDRIAEKVRFSSEYGFYGTLRKSSVQRFHAGEAIDRQGHVWKYHGEHDSKGGCD